MTIFHRPTRAGLAAVGASMLLVGCAAFQGERPATASTGPADMQDKLAAAADKSAEIATQPVRDLGVAKTEIPPVLVEAAANPYAWASTIDCGQLAAAIASLDEHLGPDYRPAPAQAENKAGKIAEAGGRTIVNTLIPFRSLVREMTGAAAAQRRLNDAVDAGYARRGFLRGLEVAKNCPDRPRPAGTP